MYQLVVGYVSILLAYPPSRARLVPTKISLATYCLHFGVFFSFFTIADNAMVSPKELDYHLYNSRVLLMKQVRGLHDKKLQ